MKKTVYILILIIFTLSACEMETSNNGDLDGYWQLCKIDTLATGGSTDMRDSTHFWGVQMKLLEIKDLRTPQNSVLFRFSKASQALHLKNPIFGNRSISDSLIHSPATLAPFGITATYNEEGKLHCVFHIDQLNGEDMVLTSKEFRLHFLKY